MANTTRLMMGDCLERMGEIEDGSVDAVVTDPPYPEIDRPYGRMTEAEWHAMMDRLVPECRRVLRPSGSAVFILQPNSERVGRMRSWLWKFMAKWTDEWGMVQDAWWWNPTALPVGGACSSGLMRSSVKSCVWLGESDCLRNQDDVLWSETESNIASRAIKRARKEYSPSGRTVNRDSMRSAASRRGGVTPFNLLPFDNNWKPDCGGNHGHGAATPFLLADWWVRYISPPGGTVLDPFVGSGTVALAALAQGRSAIGIERDPGYFDIASSRIAAARQATPLLA